MDSFIQVILIYVQNQYFLLWTELSYHLVSPCKCKYKETEKLPLKMQKPQ